MVLLSYLVEVDIFLKILWNWQSALSNAEFCSTWQQ